MPLASVVYDHPTRLTQALQDVSTQAGPRLSRIPFNRFAEPPKQNTWWLSPDPDNPAYQWGKIVVTNRDVDPHLFVGLYVEKGVGKTGAPAFADKGRGARMIMRDNWIWHDFYAALRDGTLEDEVRSTAETVGSPVLVALDAQIAEPTVEWNEERSNAKYPRDYIRFSSGEDWTIEKKGESPDLLQTFNDAKSLRDIAERIDSLKQLDWTWIDFQLGYSFATEPHSKVPAYNSESVWAAAGTPWRNWLRQSQTKPSV